MSRPRLYGIPADYVRLVRNGRWQARPYVDGERINLGLFGSETEARRAVRRYYQFGEIGRGLPKFVRRMPGGEFIAQFSFDGTVLRLGPFDSPAKAFDSARAFITQLEGPLFAWRRFERA